MEQEQEQGQGQGPERHKPMGRFLIENFQTIGIIISILLGLREKPAPGSEEERSIPNWFLHLFPSLTQEDEIEFNLARDSYPDTNLRAVETTFREAIIRDGYDETNYRLMLVGLRREYTDRLHHPAPEDKSGGRLSFEPITLRDSCTEFFSELLAESSAAGTPEEIYERQKKIALGRKLLKKTGTLKRVAHWVHENKLKTILLLILSPFFFLALAYQVLNLFLG